MDKYNGKLCRPRIETLYTIGYGWNNIMIALKPTQKWIIQNRHNRRWTIKRKNVVLMLTDDDFIELFYRTEQ